MTEDISNLVGGKYGIPTEKAKEYAALLRPFSEKVGQGNPLSDEELVRVNEIHDEMDTTYGQWYIDHPAFIGVKAISDLDWSIKKRIEDEQFEEEECQITEEWKRKEKDGTLTVEEEKRFYRRCEYIRSIIEPDYYFGPKISPDEFK